MCILLVEDEWLIRSMVAEVLREGGFAVREAGDSDQASALIVEDPAAYQGLRMRFSWPAGS